MASRTSYHDYSYGTTGHGKWWNAYGLNDERYLSLTIPGHTSQTDIIRSVTPEGEARVPLPFATAWEKFLSCPVYAEYAFAKNLGVQYPASTHDNYPAQNFLYGYDMSVPDISANDQLKMLGKIREEAVGDFALGTFLVEAGETLGMLSSTATKLARAAIATKERRYRDAVAILWDGQQTKPPKHKRFASPANAWLEFTYGWSPLYSDLHAAGKDLANFLYAPKVHRVRAGKKLKGENVTLLGGLEISTRYSNISSLTVFVESRLPAPLAVMASPWEAAWEKIPFSFVLDWVIPVGDFLSAASLSAEISGKYVYSTKKVAQFLGHKLVFNEAAGGLKFLDLKGRFIDERGSFSRIVLNNPVIPLPEVKAVEKIVGWQHCANALALLTGALTSSELNIKQSYKRRS